MKKKLALLLSLLLLLGGCSAVPDGSSNAPAPTQNQPSAAETEEEASVRAVITLSGDTATVEGEGVSVAGSVVTIGAGGEYTVRGTLDNGSLVIDTGLTAQDVTLVLDGVSITCLRDMALYVAQAKNVDIYLPAGTENRIVSGSEEDLSAYSDTASGAAIYSEDGLSFKGEGSLEICGYLNNAVTCKDDLKIKGGSLRVTAANNALRASESVTVSGGTVSVTAGNDGVKTTSSQKEGKGYIEISGGTLRVTAVGDALSAETDIVISGGALSLSTLGSELGASCRAIRAKNAVTISGGTVSVVSAGDGIKAGSASSGVGTVTLRGGALQISAAKDPVDAAVSLTVEGGSVFAVGTSKVLKTFDADSPQLFIAGTVEGHAGETVSIAGAGLPQQSLEAQYDYNVVLFSDPALSRGVSYSVAVGSVYVTVTT